jgi:hypothetical protein
MNHAKTFKDDILLLDFGHLVIRQPNQFPGRFAAAQVDSEYF